MLSLGAPAYLAAAALAAAGVVALHLLAWRRPTPTLFPTARWIPDAPVRAVSRDLRLTDAFLLALRILALLAAGLALAQPRVSQTPTGTARVILADRSRAVASVSEVRDSVRALAEGVDAVRLVWFDSSAATAATVGDTTVLSRTDRRGSLSAGLIVALREAQRLSRRFADVEIALVSPVAREELDAATGDVMRLWPAAIRLARLPARSNDTLLAALPLLPPTRDAVGAATQLALGIGAGAAMRAAAVRVVRDGASSDDSAAARAGALLLVWPQAPDVKGADATPSVLDRPRAISTGDHTVIAPLRRLPNDPAGRPVAWWNDGTVAAAERPLGAGCVREVGFLPPLAGDLPLRPAFVDVVADLLAPCRGVDWRPVPTTELTWLAAAPAAGAGAPPAALTPAREEASPLVMRALLLAALMALIAEWWLRRRRSSAVQRATASASRVREAA